MEGLCTSGFLTSEPTAPPAGDRSAYGALLGSGPARFPGRWPGIVVEWRQASGGWEGRTIIAVDSPGIVVVEARLPAQQLEPA